MNPNDLLGTRYNPAGFDAVRTMSRTAKAYHALTPYPSFSLMTKEWITEERGPLPRCQPFVQRIVTKGARWLFGKPVTFRVPDDEKASEVVNKAWTGNSMTRRSLSMAVTGALSGGVALKWSWEKAAGPKIQILDPAEHTRFYWDPQETEKLLMVRVQYPTFDAAHGKWIWYREDWTDTTLRIYKPVEMAALQPGTWDDPYQMASRADAHDKWVVDKDEPNPFGIVPFWYIRNQETGREFGAGDLWTCYPIVDQINFHVDLAHKHNQKFLDPEKAYIDLTEESDDAPDAGGPGGRDVLVTKDNAPAQGKVQVLETDATMRPHLREFIKDIKRDLFETVGSVDLEPDAITNKGNLTSAVLTQMYAPLIEATDSKRTCYGEDGVCTFFERMSKGLAKVKAEGWKELEDVQIHWPAYWDRPPEEKKAEVERQTLMVQGRMTTQERAAKAVAQIDGVIDTDDLLKEIEKEPDPAGEAGEPNGKTKESND